MAFLFGFVLAPLPAALAEGGTPCYPPPCQVQAPARAVVGDAGGATSAPTVGAPATAAGASDRSPAPFVGIGLLAVGGTLALVAGRRRRVIVLRTQPVPAVFSAPPPRRDDQEEPAFR